MRRPATRLDTSQHKTAPPCAMKLIIRSAYWGQVLRGKPFVDQATGARPNRTISCQAVLKNEGQFWGCCPAHGKRVLEMTEQHFIDTFGGDWDLYLVGSFTSESQVIHSFFLLPQNQNSVDITQQTGFNGWVFFGTIPAPQMRKKLNELLSDMFKSNDDIGYRYNHVHIEILMNEVIDYAAREKKARAKSPVDGNDAKEAATSKSSIDGDNTKRSSAKVPPIIRSDSNDASWATETTSSPLTCPSYQEPRFVPAAFSRDMICYNVPMPTMPFHMIPVPPMPNMVFHDPYTMMTATVPSMAPPPGFNPAHAAAMTPYMSVVDHPMNNAHFQGWAQQPTGEEQQGWLGR